MSKIDMDIIESYTFCKYKAYLKIIGEHGTRSDYEKMVSTLNCEAKLKAADLIKGQCQIKPFATNVRLTASTLRKDATFVFNAELEDEFFSVCIDGLKKVSEGSKSGKAIYVPMMFSGNNQTHREQKLLLEILSLLLSQYQKEPSYGYIWRNNESKARKVSLEPGLTRAKESVIDLKQIYNRGIPPKFSLNAHCKICEFRKRCRDKAITEDNISLLAGVSQKEVTNLSKKGILTVTQLAHTFRPRRKSKRAKQVVGHHHHALQALAIRDRKIYVHGSFDLPTSSVKA